MSSVSVLSWLQQVASEQLLGLAVSSALLCVAGALAVRLAVRSSAAVRFCIWQMVGVGIVASTLMLIFTHGIASDQLFPEAELSFFSQETLPKVPAENVFEDMASPMQSASFGEPTSPLKPAESQSAAADSDARSVAAFSAPVQRIEVQQSTGTTRWQALSIFLVNISASCAAVWISVAILQFLLLLRSFCRAFMIARKATLGVPEFAASALPLAQKRLNVASTVRPRLAVSSDTNVPLTMGVLRPVIVLPQCCDSWDQSRLIMVLAHELAHIERRDIFWHLVMKLACCIAWFNPLVWRAAGNTVTERELACDDRVLRSGIPATDYGQALVEIASRMAGRSLACSAVVSMAEPPLAVRLRAILSNSNQRAPVEQRTRLGIAAMFMGFSFVFSIVRPFAAPVAAQPPEAANPETRQTVASSVSSQTESIGADNTNFSDSSGVSTDVEIDVRADALGDPLPEKALLRFGTKRFQHPSSPAQILLSKDEKSVVSLDTDRLIAWDAATGKELWRKNRALPESGMEVGAAGYGVQPLGIIPETGEFVAGAGPGQIAFWNPATGESQKILVDHGMTSKSVAVSPDSNLIALGDAKQLMVCNREGQEMYAIANQPAAPMDFGGANRDRMKFGGDFSYGRFSPDGELLAMVNSEKPNTIQMFDAATGTPIRDITGKDRIVRLDFSPDSHHIVATERDIAARLYDVSSGEQQWEFVIPPAAGAESYTSAVAFRPDGNQIAVGAPIGPDETIRLLDPKTGEETARLTGSAWKPWTFQYTDDSRMLFGSGWDGAVRRWDLNTNQQLPRPGGVRASSICAMSGDGKHLAFADDEQKIHLVELPSGKTTTKLHLDGATWGQVVFSDDGTLLAGGAASDDHVHVIVWDVASADIRHNWKWPIGKDPHSNVEALSFSSSGNRLAAAVFRQSAAFVWDLSTNQRVTQVKHPEVYGMDIDATGTTLITAGWDKYIRVWNCETGLETKSHLVEVMKGEKPARDDTRMYGVKLSHDESFIATADMTSSIRFFDRDLNPISVINDVGQFVYGTLQISHNDLWIGIGSSNGSVKVFEVATGKKVWSTDNHEKHVYTVDFGARDRTILSGAEDGVCYLWDLRAGTEPTEGTSAVLFNNLMGSDGAAAYSAFRRLAETPEDTTELIVNWLAEISATKIDDAQVRNWIVALGAKDEEIVNDAKKHLLAGGLAIHESMLAEVAAGRMSGAKKIIVQDVLDDIAVGPRRVVALLTDLDTPAANEAIDRLLQTTPTGTVQRMLREAKERRKSSLRQ